MHEAKKEIKGYACGVQLEKLYIEKSHYQDEEKFREGTERLLPIPSHLWKPMQRADFMGPVALIIASKLDFLIISYTHKQNLQGTCYQKGALHWIVLRATDL